MTTPQAPKIVPPPSISPNKRLLLLIGSAVREVILRAGDLDIGTKQPCKMHDEFGGGALNCALRLKSLKPHSVETITVLSPLGADDQGNAVRAFLEEEGIDFYPKAGYQGATSRSVILITQAERTVLGQAGSAVESWATGLPNQVRNFVTKHANNSTYAMIGNIPKENDSLGDAALITEQTIEALGERAFIYFNPGRAQYSVCYHRWESVFPKIACLQMNIDEARIFIERTNQCGCRQCQIYRPIRDPQERKHVSLRCIMEFFSKINVTAVITLAGNGSVAVIRDNPMKIIFTWPEEPETLRDTTGSGDAFGAGIVWSFAEFGNPKSLTDYVRAFAVGSFWGAAACTDFGASKGLVDIPKAKKLYANIGVPETDSNSMPALVLDIKKASGLLYLLDNKKF
jgi:sugar/nucleoside kinase (ribokinase family)